MRRRAESQVARPETSDSPPKPEAHRWKGVDENCDERLSTKLHNLQLVYAHLKERVQRVRERAQIAGINRRIAYVPLTHVPEVDAVEEDLATLDFLKVYKYEKRKISRVLKCQSLQRMRMRKKTFAKWRARRRSIIRQHLRAWWAVSTARYFFNKRLRRRVLRLWQVTACEAKKIRVVSWALFKRELGREHLSICAVNFFFSNEDTLLDEGIIKSVRVGVRRKILIMLIGAWKLRLAENSRRYATASMILRRCARGHSKRLAVEFVVKGFYMWYRHVVFKRELRKGGCAPPTFKGVEPAMKEWENYLLLFSQRRERGRQADVRGRKASQRRHFTSWRVYVRWHQALETSIDRTLELNLRSFAVEVLRGWNNSCRTRGRSLRRMRVYYAAWAIWSRRKRQFRIAKLSIATSTREAKQKRHLHNWLGRLTQRRIVHMFQLARGLAVSRTLPAEWWDCSPVEGIAQGCTNDLEADDDLASSAHHEKAKKSHLSMSCEQTLVTRRFQCSISAIFLLHGRHAHWTMLKCWRGWLRVVAARSRWRSFIFLHRKNVVRHLTWTVLRAWRAATSKTAKTRLGNKFPSSLEALMVLDRTAEAFQKVSGGAHHCADVDAFLEPYASMLGGREIHRLAESADKAKQLCETAASGDVDSLKELLKAGVDPNGFSPSSSDCVLQTALHQAASHRADRYILVVSLLLRCGASPFLLDGEGRSAIDVTTNPRIAQMLLQHARRMDQKILTRREKVEWMRVASYELSTFDNSRDLWRWLTYFMLGMATAKDELRHEISRLAIAPPKSRAFNNRDCSRMRNPSSPVDHTLLIKSTLTAPLIVAAEKRAMGRDEMTSSALAQAIDSLQSQSVASHVGTADAGIERRIQWLRARKYLELSQRHPTCPVDETVVSDKKITINHHVDDFNVTKESFPCRQVTQKDQRKAFGLSQRDALSLAAGLSLAAKFETTVRKRSGEVEALHVTQDIAVAWFEEWRKYCKDRNDDDETFSQQSSADDMQDELHHCKALLEQAADSLAKARARTLARDDARLRRALIFETHSEYEGLCSGSINNRSKSSPAEQMPNLLRNWIEQDDHVVSHEQCCKDDLTSSSILLNVVPIVKKAYAVPLVAKLRKLAMMRADLCENSSYSYDGLPDSWLDPNRLKKLLWCEHRILETQRASEKKDVAKLKAKFKGAEDALAALDKAHYVVSIRLRSIGRMLYYRDWETMNCIRTCSGLIRSLTTAITDVEEILTGDKILGGAEDKHRKRHQACAPTFDEEKLSSENVLAAALSLLDGEDLHGVARDTMMSGPDPVEVSSTALGDGIETKKTIVIALESRLSREQRALERGRANRAATLTALRGASLHLLKLLCTIDTVTGAIANERDRVLAEVKKHVRRLELASNDLDAVRRALDPNREEFSVGQLENEPKEKNSTQSFTSENTKLERTVEGEEVLCGSSTRPIKGAIEPDAGETSTPQVKRHPSIAYEENKPFVVFSKCDHDKKLPKTIEERYADSVQLFFAKERAIAARNPYGDCTDISTSSEEKESQKDVSTELRCQRGTLTRYWSRISASIRDNPEKWEFSRRATSCLDDAVVFDHSEEMFAASKDDVLARLEKMTYTFSYANLGSIDADFLERLYLQEATEAKSEGLPEPIYPAHLPDTFCSTTRDEESTAIWEASTVAPYIALAATSQDESDALVAIVAAKLSAKMKSEFEPITIDDDPVELGVDHSTPLIEKTSSESDHAKDQTGIVFAPAGASRPDSIVEQLPCESRNESFHIPVLGSNETSFAIPIISHESVVQSKTSRPDEKISDVDEIADEEIAMATIRKKQGRRDGLEGGTDAETKIQVKVRHLPARDMLLEGSFGGVNVLRHKGCTQKATPTSSFITESHTEEPPGANTVDCDLTDLEKLTVVDMPKENAFADFTPPKKIVKEEEGPCLKNLNSSFPSGQGAPGSGEKPVQQSTLARIEEGQGSVNQPSSTTSLSRDELEPISTNTLSDRACNREFVSFVTPRGGASPTAEAVVARDAELFVVDSWNETAGCEATYGMVSQRQDSDEKSNATRIASTDSALRKRRRAVKLELLRRTKDAMIGANVRIPGSCQAQASKRLSRAILNAARSARLQSSNVVGKIGESGALSNSTNTACGNNFSSELECLTRSILYKSEIRPSTTSATTTPTTQQPRTILADQIVEARRRAFQQQPSQLLEMSLSLEGFTHQNSDTKRILEQAHNFGPKTEERTMRRADLLSKNQFLTSQSLPSLNRRPEVDEKPLSASIYTTSLSCVDHESEMTPSKYEDIGHLDRSAAPPVLDLNGKGRYSAKQDVGFWHKDSNPEIGTSYSIPMINDESTADDVETVDDIISRTMRNIVAGLSRRLKTDDSNEKSKPLKTLARKRTGINKPATTGKSQVELPEPRDLEVTISPFDTTFPRAKTASKSLTLREFQIAREAADARLRALSTRRHASKKAKEEFVRKQRRLEKLHYEPPTPAPECRSPPTSMTILAEPEIGEVQKKPSPAQKKVKADAGPSIAPPSPPALPRKGCKDVEHASVETEVFHDLDSSDRHEELPTILATARTSTKRETEREEKIVRAITTLHAIHRFQQPTIRVRSRPAATKVSTTAVDRSRSNS